MKLDRYLRALIHYWYVLAVILGMGILGTWIYMRVNRAFTAVTTVAVLEPAVTSAIDSQQAQINFASVVESLTVSERVVQKLGLTILPEHLQGTISVKLSRTLVPSVATPLYIVQVQHPDPDIAIQLANTVVEEARVVFAELNELDPNYIETALQPEEERLRAELDEAQSELQAFEDDHHAWILHTQIEAKLNLVNALSTPARLTAVTEFSRAQLEELLVEAQAELERLYSMVPEYERHVVDAQLAVTTLYQLSDAETFLDFRRSPYTVEKQIQEARERWDEAQQALAEFLQENLNEETQADTDESLTEESTSEDPAQASLLEPSEGNPEGETQANSDEPGEDDSTEQDDEKIDLLDYPDRLINQRELVRNLQLLLLYNQVPSVGYEQALAPEEAELDRLLGLLPEYEMLATRVAQVEASLAMLSARKVELILKGSFAPAAQIKVLDSAHLQSDQMGDFIIGLFSLVFSVSVGLVAIYLIAYIVQIPLFAEEVQDWIEAPILASVPRASSRWWRVKR